MAVVVQVFPHLRYWHAVNLHCSGYPVVFAVVLKRNFVLLEKWCIVLPDCSGYAVILQDITLGFLVPLSLLLIPYA